MRTGITPGYALDLSGEVHKGRLMVGCDRPDVLPYDDLFHMVRRHPVEVLDDGRLRMWLQRPTRNSGPLDPGQQVQIVGYVDLALHPLTVMYPVGELVEVGEGVVTVALAYPACRILWIEAIMRCDAWIRQPVA